MINKTNKCVIYFSFKKCIVLNLSYPNIHSMYLVNHKYSYGNKNV